MRRTATLLVLLGACAQPPIALPPPLPEDCGLTAQDREDLERWERQMFEPIRHLDAHGTIALAVVEIPQTPARRCATHGRALEIPPAIAVPGLLLIGFFTTAERISLEDPDRFSVATWEYRHGPRGADEAVLHVRAGCYLREEYVPVLACNACRDEYRRWCREYLEQRDRWLEEIPGKLAQERREWRNIRVETLRDARELD